MLLTYVSSVQDFPFDPVGECKLDWAVLDRRLKLILLSGYCELGSIGVIAVLAI